MKRKILIVDDDIVTLKIIKKYLEDKYEVISESSGYRVIEEMDNYDVDLILLDYDMPMISGIQTLDEIKKHHRLKNVPVVFMIGVYSPNIMNEVVQKGATDCLVKTSTKEDIILTLERVIDESAKSEAKYSVLVLTGDVNNLKSIKETLESDIYEVKAVRTAIEVVELLRFYTPGLFVIGTDAYGNVAQNVYDVLAETLRSKSIKSIVMDKMYFDVELLDRVRAAME